ncbi:hypothetical protein PC129_g16262 [Phytophthora cactorum]|uniref:Elicitin n=1 Tax=Phytophthora cactorum TaxID=29920 RepID=A0A8T1K330_9STRA|nr:hypothetical protein Pcac1_g15715 [Phytophthora cactorum]KAG2806811.1 hypothetical protein PC112_g17682 [Phytophthora cactorum]KAG2808483.1 hypothetical protein PC111_g16464 [Phytophthora cactorum]KAG2847677.1 hypothetical protein PC113_g17705 [Phytophthora cactorum]KAG2890920.1 hypothetical protein PC114_g17222 [Phytophthora cactorum]
MKSFFAAVAVAVAAFTSQASADTCPTSVLSALLTNANIQQCATDSGYAFTAANIPDQATIDKMCASTACNGLLADVQAMNLEECQLPVGPGINLKADLVDYVPANCPSTDSPATDAPSPESPATEAPSPDSPATDAPVTDAPTSPDNSTATDAPSTPVTAAPTQTPIAC